MTKISSSKQLIVLGNGFDLSSGLKTTYKNFFDYYYRNIGIEESKLNLVRDKIIQMSELSQNDNNIFSKINSWMLLFKDRSLSMDSNWMNVEETILYYLTAGIIPQTNAVLNKWKKLARDKYDVSHIIISLPANRSSVLIANKIISTELSKVNYDKEKFFLQSYTEDFVAKFLLEELQELENEFENFLFKEAGFDIGQDGLGIDYFEKARNLITTIVKNNYEFTDESYNIMCFNYTDPWSEVWERNGAISEDFNSPKRYINVHGRAVRSSENTIIFGIDNQTIQSTRLVNIFEDGITTIKIFGHSLGEADYSYFQQMFDYFDLYNNNSIKLYFYYKKYDQRSTLEYLHEQSVIITRLLEKYGDTMNNKSHGKNLITRLELMRRLHIIELK